MWERRKKDSQLKRIDSLIGAGTVVNGDITYAGGLRIDGQVKGNVMAAEGEPGTLVVSEHARVDGEIRAANAVINGNVNGPITVADHFELQPKARITGDVSYQTLEMHVGAMIEGRLARREPGDADVVELKRQTGI
jgi:cytoskeletal protein CcmA (bactofilin family)